MPCFLCNEEHLTRKCPTLWEDKKEGFYSGGHYHDTTEEPSETRDMFFGDLLLLCDHHHSIGDKFFPGMFSYRIHFGNTLSAEHTLYMTAV
jgi:hypothetical protein